MTFAARALLDVLVAGLWQGACIALVAGAILALTGRRLNAATRCVVWQAVLLTMLVVPLSSTFASALGHRAETSSFITQVEAPAPAVTHEALAPAAAPRIHVALSDGIVLALAGAWLIGIAICALRVVAGAMQLSRLVRRSERLSDRGRVRIYASPDTSMPLAFGLIAPSVIVPAELAARGGEQLECILHHELAHVRRRDAWANACERIVHAVLFANPAVVLVLRAIAFEREAACDDWAVVQSPDPDAYVRSLASFALRRVQPGSLVACGVTGFGRATAARLHRLDDARRNGALSLAHHVLGGFTIVLLLLALGMQMFAPSIALAANDPVVIAAVDPGPCPKRVMGPPRLPRSIPVGLRSEVTVRVAADGTIATPTLVKPSGNARFDRLTSDDARLFLTAVGKVTPPNCTVPHAGTYDMTLATVMMDHPNHLQSPGAQWTIRGTHIKKTITLLAPYG